MKAMESQKGEARGSRTGKEVMIRKGIYTMWLDFSKVTVDRRNGRDQMKMKEM